MRNVISLLSFHLPHLRSIRMIGLRSSFINSVQTLADRWVVYNVQMPLVPIQSRIQVEREKAPEAPESVKEVERGVKIFGKIKPKSLNLGTMMDSLKVAESQVYLNLKLIRWRTITDLPLENIFETRCLLIGSGTLGCNVARGLVGWGVKHITFVDNSRVSFSNPVRQTLFTYEDCLNGGRPKAEAAADRLKQIFPSCCVRGVNLSIPMPGHPISDSPDSLSSFHSSLDTLIQLIRSLLLLPPSFSLCSPSSIINHQSSIINHQPSIINHQPSIINHQSSIINHQSSTINHQSSTINHQSSIINH